MLQLPEKLHSYSVEIDDNNNSISIFPNRTIPCNHMIEIMTMITKLGYKYWKPGGPDGEFIFSKKGE